MNGPVRLFQYWNTSSPPDEVRVLLESWERDPGVDQQLFDQSSARAYISDKFGSRLTAVFDACANPALQSDFFRLAAIYAEGGLYVDADLGSKERIAELIFPAPIGLLVSMVAGPNNDLIFARHPRLPLIGRLLERVVSNIEARVSNNVATVSGPTALISLFNDAATRHLFDGWLVESRPSALRMISMPLEMEYKDGPDDWRKVIWSRDKSIFATEAEPLAEPALFPVDQHMFARLPARSVPMIQYADTMPEGADDLAAIASWRSDPLFRYHFFDRTTGEAYLARTCKPAMVQAFAQTKGEDQRAEFLALVWLRNKGGLFVRNGLANRGGWDWFLAAAPGGLLTGRIDPFLTNDILYSPAPRTDLIVRSLTLFSRALLADAGSAAPKTGVLPPQLNVIMKHLHRRQSLIDSGSAGWRVEDRYSLGRFLEPIRDLS